MKKLFLYLFIALGFVACRKDMEETTIIDTVYTPPVIKVSGTVAGLVTDEQGNGVEGAVVHIDNQQKVTGPGGYFVFANAVLNANGTFIKVNQPGYFHSSTRIFPKANSINYATLTLMAKQNLGQVDAIAGGAITLADGARITLPAGGIISSDGSAYSGEVLVAARWLNPASPELSKIMPGNLQGISSQQEEVALASYGMLAVELSSPTGELLNINPASKAELLFPIPSSLRNNAPNEIPLWYFDENTGLWREQGKATKVGNDYVGLVNHFSYWNCDYPFPLINMQGQLVTPGGSPLPNVLVTVTVAGSTITGSGHTNNDGVFSGKVPADQTLILRVLDNCANIVYEQTLSPSSTDINLGAISLASSVLPSTTVSGSFLDCAGNPVPMGILQVCMENICNYIIADADGNFSKSIAYCNTATELTLQGFDVPNNMQGGIDTYPIAADINAGVISICAAQITEYIRVNVDGDEFTYIDPLFAGGPGALNRIGSYIQDSSYTVEFTFPVSAPGVYTGAGVRFKYYVFEPSFLAGYCDNPCNSMSVTVTEYGAVGELIKGTFTGTMDFYNAAQQVFPNTPFSGEFSVIRSQ